MKINLPKTGYLKRMGVYLTEMYPIPIRLFNATLLYLSFMILLARLHSLPVSLLSPITITGIFSLFAIMLILRMMDEIKDKNIDCALFGHRPLPSGKVLESDLYFSLVFMITTYLLANIWLAKAFWVALFVLIYSLLMFKYFFISTVLRRYLLLNLATHNPIIPIILFYLVTLFRIEYNLDLRDVNWQGSILLIILFWLLFFAWEIARKIRCKIDENSYVTYSQIFGQRGAVLIAGSAQTVAFFIAFYLYHTLTLSLLFITIILLAYLLTISGHIRFVLKPNRKTSRLRPFAELYILCSFLAGISESIVSLI